MVNCLCCHIYKLSVAHSHIYIVIAYYMSIIVHSPTIGYDCDRLFPTFLTLKELYDFEKIVFEIYNLWLAT